MKTHRLLVWTLLAIWILPAKAQIQQPQLGIILDSDGVLRPVLGIPASASLGDPVLPNVNSFACSSTLCLAKTDAALTTFAPRTPQVLVTTPCSCPGPALIALDRHGGAWIYVPATGQLFRWQDRGMYPLGSLPAGQVLGLRATADGVDYAITYDVPERELSFFREISRPQLTRENRLVRIEHYSTRDGSVTVIDSFNASGPVMLLDTGILFASGDQVTLRRPNGQELAFSVAGANTFQPSGNGFVEISAVGGLWLLRTDPGKEQLSLLPLTPRFITRGRR